MRRGRGRAEFPGSVGPNETCQAGESLRESKAKLRAAKVHPCRMLGTTLTPPPGNDKKQ
jgi:hypothetical protein